MSKLGPREDGLFVQACFEAAWHAAIKREPAIELEAARRQETRARLAYAVLEATHDDAPDLDEVVSFALRAISSFRSKPSGC